MPVMEDSVRLAMKVLLFFYSPLTFWSSEHNQIVKAHLSPTTTLQPAGKGGRVIA